MYREEERFRNQEAQRAQQARWRRLNEKTRGNYPHSFEPMKDNDKKCEACHEAPDHNLHDIPLQVSK